MLGFCKGTEFFQLFYCMKVLSRFCYLSGLVAVSGKCFSIGVKEERELLDIAN